MYSIPKSEFGQRLNKLQEQMRRDGFEAVLAYGNEAEPQYVRYLSDYWPSFETAGVLVPCEGKPVLLIGPESHTYASDRSVIPDIRLLKAFRESSDPEYPGRPLDTFETVLRELLGKGSVERLGVCGYSLMNVGVYTALREALPLCEISKADYLLNNLRMIKTENELACMRKAAEITRLTFDFVLERIRVGMTETQVAGLALGKMHELGAERESYPPWILTGEGSNQAISRPRRKAIRPGDLTFLQIGARVAGYASSIGRPVVFGHASDAQKNLIAAGYAAQRAVIGALRADRPAREVADIHQTTLRQLGYGDHILYGPCHGNGQMEGEAPWIETDCDWILKENMTFCVDIFLGDAKTKTGLRMEDVVRVTKDGCENLTDYPQRLFEL